MLRPLDSRGPLSSRYIKWNDEVIGIIGNDNSVSFTEPNFNTIVSIYTGGHSYWTPIEFNEFLADRIISRYRRDIERLLYRMQLRDYNVSRISDITRAIHPKDLLWIAHSVNERLDEAMSAVFSSIFLQRIDMEGNSIDSPEGVNIKRYGVFNDSYGIYKRRLSPVITDVESEIAVHLLAEKLGVPTCPAFRADKDTIFSAFLYDFSKEYLVHFRHLAEEGSFGGEYRALIKARPQFRSAIDKMMLLDFITRQDDRHFSNIAICVKDSGEEFYPLYDNGRSLFYEDTEEMVKTSCSDPRRYATVFGQLETYWTYVQEIAKEHNGLDGLVNLGVTDLEIEKTLAEAGFTGYRFDGAFCWISATLDILRAL